MIFTKVHGLGNDFVVVDDRENKYTQNLSDLAIKVCHRRTGIGADGLVFVRNSEKCDVRMQIFNSDGSEAEMCGNAIRCFGKYCHDKGIVKGDVISVETLAGTMVIHLTVENGIATYARVDMGMPETRRPFIPVVGEGDCQLQTLTSKGKEFTFSTILLGVPHTVVFMKDGLPCEEDFQKHGADIEAMTSLFPRKTNVNFAHVINDHTVEVRTFERGCGPTLACGTGCSSVATCCYMAGFTGNKVEIKVELGSLFIEVAENGHVFMTGPAAFSFEGEY